MFIGLQKKISIVFFLYVLLIGSLAAELTARTDYSTRDPNRPSEESNEMMILRELGLNEDVNNAEILALLDQPNKPISSVILLIRYRRISAATPKLLKIIHNEDAQGISSVFKKRWAAEALCDFGNKEWVPVIKAMAEDPNSQVSRSSLKYDVAGLLARAGDFSQIELVMKGLADEKDFIRHKAMSEISKFAHPTNPVTDRAAELLVNFAKNEPNERFREYAIEGLEKLAKVKPTLWGKVIEALEANVNSPDKDLQAICKTRLKTYKKPAEPNSTSQ